MMDVLCMNVQVGGGLSDGGASLPDPNSFSYFLNIISIT